MPFNLLSLPAGGIDSSIQETALYALIGFLVVFAGILFLVFIVWLVGKLMGKFGVKNGKIEKKTEEKTTFVPIVAEDEIPEETVAVIMAALTAYYQTNHPKCEFTVKRIKRI